jgi:starch phosphorylase
MKAALNGVPSLSVLDGWWIEGCAEGVTGWAIDDAETEAAEAACLYDKLEKRIAPMYANPAAWARMQQHCIAINGSFFNTHRMLAQYVCNAYYPFPSLPDTASPTPPVNEPAVEALLNEPALV